MPSPTRGYNLLHLPDARLANIHADCTSATAHRIGRLVGDSAALRYFGEAAKLRPDDPAPHRGMAEIYTHIGKTEQATAKRQEADRLSNR